MYVIYDGYGIFGGYHPYGYNHVMADAVSIFTPLGVSACVWMIPGTLESDDA